MVSKNGNLLLAIGPEADGTIPDLEQQLLMGMGAWLKKMVKQSMQHVLGGMPKDRPIWARIRSS